MTDGTPGRTAINQASAPAWLMPLAEWLRRKRWAMNVARCERYRAAMSFKRRLIFDDEVRPFLTATTRIAYPDAFYYISIADVLRATKRANER